MGEAALPFELAGAVLIDEALVVGLQRLHVGDLLLLGVQVEFAAKSDIHFFLQVTC